MKWIEIDWDEVMEILDRGDDSGMYESTGDRGRIELYTDEYERFWANCWLEEFYLEIPSPIITAEQSQWIIALRESGLTPVLFETPSVNLDTIADSKALAGWMKLALEGELFTRREEEVI